jgi:hypothetical protein
MGYTHYYTIAQNEFSVDELKALQTIIKKYRKILKVTNKPDTSLCFNGKDDGEFEDFYVAPKTRNFCKTARLPYDLPVCECLLVLKHFNKDTVVRSDGFWIDKETADEFVKTQKPVLDGNWNTALENVKNEFGFEFEFELITETEGNHTYYRLALK